MKPIALTLGLLFPAAAQAACFGAGDPLFHCTVQGGKKAVDVCQQAEVVLYRFGPPKGAAEMLLARREIGVDLRPWNGIGRYIWEELTVHNGTVSYVVHHSFDRNTEGAETDGGVIVMEGERELARLNCDAGSVTEADFYPIYEAKEAAGQQWCRDGERWAASCE